LALCVALAQENVPLLGQTVEVELYLRRRRGVAPIRLQCTLDLNELALGELEAVAYLVGRLPRGKL